MSPLKFIGLLRFPILATRINKGGIFVVVCGPLWLNICECAGKPESYPGSSLANIL